MPNFRLQVRHDTATNWTGKSLLEGEFGFDVTNGILKIGGASGTTWASSTQFQNQLTITGTAPISVSGTVISLASTYGDTQNPYGSKAQSYVLAGPAVGSGNPSFRALVAGDIPTLNQNTTGSAGSVANMLTIGTGLSGTSYNGSAAVTIAIDTTVATLTGTQTLTNKTINGATLNNVTIASITSIPTLNQSTTGTAAKATAIVGGAAQSILYQSATDNTTSLAAGTPGWILKTNGTGSAPSWVDPGTLTVATAGTTTGNAATATTAVNATNGANFSGGYRKITVATTAPSSPTIGDVWISY